ncbi:substrate ABC transporter ATP-binding component [Mycoplasma feriruminatoris]|uniref:Substrate ABC transporter ATP-binding component n=1 Tax=Mycoplasma feriruminatoris TaxID=1179777 RepID=A0ABY8HV38_9MOLU|nr:MFS transporter [Mycoplasma feriruminatoris]WFQ93468.1 substrate ABC transporter ATP-binding component [Mycoplasma feriruminatoris]
MENKINYKTYKSLKYLATISSVILAICLLLTFVQFTKDKPIFTSLTPFISLQVILLILGFVSLIVYIIYRVKILKTSNYVYMKKEIIYLYSSFSLYLFSFILTSIYLLIGLLVNNSNAIKILFYVFISLFFICIILSSIFETLSRLKEQLLLYKQEYQHQQVLKQQKQQANKTVIVKKTNKNNKTNNKSKNPFIEE